MKNKNNKLPKIEISIVEEEGITGISLVDESPWGPYCNNIIIQNSKIECPWCGIMFYEDKTEEEYNEQFISDKQTLKDMGYEPGDEKIIVCDECYDNRYSPENIINREK